MTRVLLRAEHVVKRFGGLVAVNDVSFELYEGEILGLIGPNGAGKTTLFNCINGIYPPNEGRIYFEDRDITGWPPSKLARLGMARTFQIVRPLPELTVRENVMVGAAFGLHRYPLHQAERIADEVLDFVGLADRSEHLAGSLNVAQKKRLELARALAARPKLLLLDEVLAGLNPAEVDAMVDIIRQIREQGITILMIEHVMRAIMNLSDRILVLNFGELIAQGTPQEVANNEAVIKAYLGDPELMQRFSLEDAA